MLCACSGERYQFEERPQSPESLATRDYSVGGGSSRTTGFGGGGGGGGSSSVILGTGGGADLEESKLDDSRVDDVVESTLKETLSLNYEEARALLGRLEYQRGNFDAALQVFQGIDVRGLRPRMIRAIAERTARPRKPRLRGGGESSPANVMSLHSVSLLVEAILLKSKSLEGLDRFKDAAMECKTIIDIIESAWPHGMPEVIVQGCKLTEMFHQALELFPKLWKLAGFLEESITAYRRALIKPWNLDPEKCASLQKNLMMLLLYSGAEGTLPLQIQQQWGNRAPGTNTEEAVLLLLILMRKMALQEISWDPEIINHLIYGLSLTGQFELLGGHIEQLLPGVYNRADRWYLLALCYSASGLDNVALNLLSKITGKSERQHRVHLPSLLLGAKLCGKYSEHAGEGINFALKAIQAANNENKHFIGVATHLLGVCYGHCARSSISDSQRLAMQYESLKLLQQAAVMEKADPEVIHSFASESAMQRNLNLAKENASNYLDLVGGNSASGWKLLTLVVSGEQSLSEAEEIVDLAIDESGRVEQLDLLRVKALLQVAQEMPKNAIETYRVLLAMIQAQDFKTWSPSSEVKTVKDIEMETWLDLARIYMRLGSFNDSYLCLDKVKSIELFSPELWHAKGMLLEAQSLQKEALISFLVSLSIRPDYVPSIVSMAAILRSLGGSLVGTARSLLMNAIRLEPTNHEAWLNLGYISKMEGLLHQAADCFQAAYELRQSSPVQKIGS